MTTNLYQTALEAFQSGGRELFNALGIQDRSSIVSHDWVEGENNLKLVVSRKNGEYEEKEFSPPIEVEEFESPKEETLSEIALEGVMKASAWVQENKSSMDELYERFINDELDLSDPSVVLSIITFKKEFEQEVQNIKYVYEFLEDAEEAAKKQAFKNIISDTQKYLPLPRDEEQK